MTELRAIASLKAGQIADWRADQLARAKVLMKNYFFIDGVAGWMMNPLSEGAGELRSWLRSMLDEYGLDDVLLMDARGRIRLDLGGKNEAFSPEMVAATATAFRDQKPITTDLHTDAWDSVPHIDTIVPLIAVPEGEPVKVGALILRYNAPRYLYPLIQTWPIPSHSAETLLVRRDGDEVLFLNDLRHQKDTALKLRIPLSQTNVPAVMAVLGKEGVVEGVDYRGVKVISVLKSIPGTPWYMVAKMDEAEAFAKSRFFSVLVLSGILILFAAGAGAVGVVWQRNAKTQYQALYLAEEARRGSEERHLATLMSVGDGVITTDGEGRVELMNPVAENLCGWPQQEARDKPLDDVFHIINEETRQEVESPVRRVIGEGMVVGLANHTLLIARDGTERPIADSGAPIRNDRGEITGVVLAFRDQTNERKAERVLQKSEEQYRRLFQNMQECCAYCQVIFEGGKAEDYIYLSLNDMYKAHPGLKGVVGKRASEVMPGFRESDPRLLEAYGSVALTGKPDKFEIFVEALQEWLSVSVYCPERGYFVAIFDVITERKKAEAEREKLETQFRQAQKMEAIGRLAGGVAHDFNNMLQVILGHTEMVLQKTSGGSPLKDSLVEIRKAAQRAASITGQLLAFARRQIVSPRVIDLNETVSGTLKMLQRLIGEEIDLAWKAGHDAWPVKIDPSQIDQLLANLVINARDAIAGTGKITIETGGTVFDESYCARHAGYTPGNYTLLAVSDNGSGMDKETVGKIFEPFFTTKRMGEGTGLGLATVYGIVKQNGGFINVYTEPGEGTTFKIYLPRTEGEITKPPKQGDAETPICGGTETLLLVEDDETIRKLCLEMLEQLGYTVHAAATPGEAIQFTQSYSGGIHLLITDVVLPEMNARELAGQLVSIRPGLKCLYMSGYSANVIAHRGILAEGVSFLQKPFALEALANKIREVLAQ